MNNFLNLMYHNSPLFVQNLGVNAYGLYWYYRRFGGIFKKMKIEFDNREYYNYEQWKEYQQLQLRSLLKSAYNNVPYYKKLFKEIDLKLPKIENFQLSDLKYIPFLTKDDLRKYGKSSLLSNNRNKDGIFLKSSGSTGTPTNIYFSKYNHQVWQAAMESRIRKWANVSYKTPRATIGGRKISKIDDNVFHRYNHIEKQTYLSAYHISEKNISNYIESLNKNKIQYLTGYAYSIYSLSKIFHSLNIKAPKMLAVITSSEQLTVEMKKIIEQVFDCKCFDSYSGVETCGMITESPERKLLLSPDIGIMELIDSQNNYVQNGIDGEAVFTGFITHDQPLIRYKIGDIIRKSKKQEIIGGRCMPVIDEIVGRIEDRIITKDGRTMVRFHSIYYDILGLIKGQIVQVDYDKFIFNLEIDKNFKHDKSKNIIKKRLMDQIGHGIDISFNFPKHIPKGPNGKMKAVVSKIKDMR